MHAISEMTKSYTIVERTGSNDSRSRFIPIHSDSICTIHRDHIGFSISVKIGHGNITNGIPGFEVDIIIEICSCRIGRKCRNKESLTESAEARDVVGQGDIIIRGTGWYFNGHFHPVRT